MGDETATVILRARGPQAPGALKVLLELVATDRFWSLLFFLVLFLLILAHGIIMIMIP